MTLDLPEAFAIGRRDSTSRLRQTGAQPPVPPRIKKLVGLFLLLPGLAGYVIGAMLLAERIPDFWLLKLVYFILAGIAWSIPAHFLMRWMEKDLSQNGK